jgi:phosphate:Na+ symporter
LFDNAVFEIVSHALSIHRDDIKSVDNIKKVIKRSKEDMRADVDALYYSKVKKIYGEIITYATRGQSKFKLSEVQNQRVSELKIANRYMVEIIKIMKDIGHNVSHYLASDNRYMQKEYDKFRKKIAKTLRVIHLYRSEKDNKTYYKKLIKYREEARDENHQTTNSIDRLIRDNLVSVEMASSLVNDNENVKDTIKKLITIAELLYGRTDSLLENGKE